VPIIVFVALTIVLTQITSNTAAIAIVIPITISTFQTLGVNPIPMVFIVAAAGNYGLMLPSSSGGPAIAAGYGVDLKTMFKWGSVLTGLVILTLVVGGYLLATFWSGFGVA
jgi:sodium-dependent dicarboxylate transporter 2/3/5